MGANLPCKHASPGDEFDYKAFKIKLFQTEQGWAAMIMKADGNDIVCGGQKSDHYLTTDYTRTRDYAIKHAREAVDDGTVT